MSDGEEGAGWEGWGGRHGSPGIGAVGEHEVGGDAAAVEERVEACHPARASTLFLGREEVVEGRREEPLLVIVLVVL